MFQFLTVTGGACCCLSILTANWFINFISQVYLESTNKLQLERPGRPGNAIPAIPRRDPLQTGVWLGIIVATWSQTNFTVDYDSVSYDLLYHATAAQSLISDSSGWVWYWAEVMATAGRTGTTGATHTALHCSSSLPGLAIRNDGNGYKNCRLS